MTDPLRPRASDAVDEYLARLPPPARAALGRVRATIRKAVPGAEETVSYGVPTLKRHGTYVVYFAAFKEHYSLYPASDRLLAVVRGASRYRVSKGTLRFPLAEPVPVRLIERIARFLAKEAAARRRGQGKSG